MSNVQAGDIARLVAPYAVPGRGAFVRVLRSAPNDVFQLCGATYSVKSGLVWICEGWVRNVTGQIYGPEVAIYDSCLRRVDPLAEPAETEALRGDPAPAERIDVSEVAHG